MTGLEILLSILAGVVANSVSSVIANSPEGKIADIEKRSSLRDKIEKDNSLRKIIKVLILENKYKKHEENSLEVKCITNFLTSQEFNSQVKKLMASSIMPSSSNDISKIKYVINKCYEYYMGEYYSELDLELIITAIMKAISRAKSLTDDYQTTLLSEKRYVKAYNEMSCLQNMYALWEEIHPKEIIEILAFEKIYQRQLAFRFSKITPPNTGEAVLIPIDDIYVKPTFKYYSKTPKGRINEDVNYKEFIENSYRDVVLGNPGNGKTTLMEKISYDLSAKVYKERYSEITQTPILVTLRDYAVYRKKENGTILDYIYEDAKIITQTKVPEKAFEYYIYNGKAVVLFDGLDELIDIQQRKNVCKEIEAFSNIFSSVKIIVTSRKTGYQNAPLRNDVFNIVEISNFEKEQVEEYVNKWFRAFDDKYKPQAEEKVSGFLRDCKYAEDLVSNPLMLSLLCSIYKGENYIPENRPEIYKKCSEMLFEKWDKGRNIPIELPFRVHLAPALMHLAYLVYSNQELQAGIKEERLVEETRKYLQEVRFPDEEEARAAAEDFVEFCKGRAWVFTDIGQGIFQFTHRTFLEYYSSYYLVRKYEKIEDLYEHLKQYISRGEWEIVSQLSLQIFNEKQEGCVDRFVNKALVEVSRDTIGKQGINILFFCSNMLNYTCPSPLVIDTLVSTIIDVIISKLKYSPDSSALINSLISSSSDNVSNVCRAFNSHFEKTLKKGDADSVSISLEIMFFLPSAIESLRSAKNRVPVSYLLTPLLFSLQRNWHNLKSIVEKDNRQNSIAFSLGIIDLNHLLNSGSHSAIYTDAYTLFNHENSNSVANIIKYNIENSLNLSDAIEYLTCIGKYVLESYRNTVKVEDISSFVTVNMFENNEIEKHLQSDSLFGYYITYCMMYEIQIARNSISKYGTSNNLKNIMLGRMTDSDSYEVLSKINTKNFNSNHINILSNWIEDKYSFFYISDDVLLT